MIQSITFASLNPGPRLLALGAVHGNEKCGTYAIRRVLKEIEDKSLTIEKGSVTFVPICNPKAFDADVRFIERNLNRFLVPQAAPDCYEAQIGNILCPILEKTDVLLDLHSYSAGGDPFVFVGPGDEVEFAFARSLGAAALMNGWQAAYAASGKAQEAVHPDEPVGTTEYARRFGAKAVTLECGQHKDPHAPEFAYLAIRRALAHLGMAQPPANMSPVAQAPHIEVKRVFFRGQAGRFVKLWKHLETVKSGDIIARDDNDAPITAPGDGYVILPHIDTLPETEWFYWGQKCA